MYPHVCDTLLDCELLGLLGQMKPWSLALAGMMGLAITVLSASTCLLVAGAVVAEPNKYPLTVASSQHGAVDSTQHVPNGHSSRDMGQTSSSNPTFLMVVPDDASAMYLASDKSGVARRAGVQLEARRRAAGASSGNLSLLEISGSSTSIATACYLLQVQLWMHSAMAAGPGC
ncbi:unnamed protein product [Polarella glacialis]|uniref:Uncharacterized protein n=1 Tax=Polarella glacialis TaxID=89957 RepID=A0A813ID90_POLGL|nr:unnamed protein product [Polarella glacialis]CAE8648987.1 unnamed protein product [Polarella glacialis]